MKAVSKTSGLESSQRPCKYFHLIVGCEWGAVHAILLGRLQYTIAERREWLQTLWYPYGWSFLRIFPMVPWLRSIWYKRRFQDLVKATYPENNGELPSYEENPQRDRALTMVLVSDPTSIAKPKRFRSYMGDGGFDGPDSNKPIWKVALAAIVTPLDLDPVVFPATATGLGYTCIASSLARFTNPSWISLIKAQE